MIRLTIFISTVMILISVCSCTQPLGKIFYVKADSVRNLTEESKVYCKNVPVGKVTDLKLLPNQQVLIEVNIEGPLYPTRGDTFAIVDYDYSGFQAVELILGKIRKDPYENSDTIPSVILHRKPNVQLDSITKKIVSDSLIAPYIR